MTKKDEYRITYLKNKIEEYESLFGFKVSSMIDNKTTYLNKDIKIFFECKMILKKYLPEYYEKYCCENLMGNFVVNNKIILKEITLALIISLYNKSKVKQRTNVQFYRGQTNYEWGLCPSICRDDKKSLVTLDYINYRYNKTGFIEKYQKYIDPSYKTVDYISMSFAQHACSYCPFIDITKEKNIAQSFALSNPNKFNDFEYKTSAVFTINAQESNIIKNLDEINSFLNQLNFIVGYNNRKTFKIGESYELTDNYGHRMLFEFTSIENIINILTPKYIVFDYSNNDRIKYQKGAFILFYDCLIINNKIFYELNSSICINKEKIENFKKKNLLSKIYKYEREYDQSHLYNPYLIFNE